MKTASAGYEQLRFNSRIIGIKVEPGEGGGYYAKTTFFKRPTWYTVTGKGETYDQAVEDIRNAIKLTIGEQ